MKPRFAICGPCRQGHHVDHYGGVRLRADNTDPVVCDCPKHPPTIYVREADGGGQLEMFEAVS